MIECGNGILCLNSMMKRLGRDCSSIALMGSFAMFCNCSISIECNTAVYAYHKAIQQRNTYQSNIS